MNEIDTIIELLEKAEGALFDAWGLSGDLDSEEYTDHDCQIGEALAAVQQAQRLFKDDE